jgi:hypothetical protein
MQVKKSFSIFIHNGTEFGSNDVEIYLETGKQVKMDLSKTMTYRQPSPYSDWSRFKLVQVGNL